MKREKYLAYENEEDQRLARIISVIIWATWVGYLFVLILGIVFHDYALISLTLVGSALLLVLNVQLSQQKLQTSSLSLVLIELATVTFIATVGQGIRDLALLGIPIMILFAGLVLDKLFFRISIALMLLAVLWLSLGEKFGWFVTKPFEGEMENWFYLVGVVIIMLITALAVDLLTKNMRVNLERARNEIAERKRTLDALQESEAKFRALFENNSAVMLLIDPASSDIVDANPAASAFYGWSLDELKLKKIIDINILAEEEVKAEMQKAVRGQRKHFQFQHRLCGGEIRDVEVVSSPIQHKGQTLLYSIVTDTTESKRAEKILADSEERFRLMIENAPLGYQSLDIDGNFIHVNPIWLEMLGYEHEEVMGHWFGDFVVPEERDAFRKRFPIFKAAGQIHSEFEMLDKNGSTIFVSFEGRIGYDTAGNFKQTHCMLQDITEKRNAEEKIMRSENELKKAQAYAHVGSWVWNIKAGKLEWSDEMYQIFGISKENFSGNLEEVVANTIHPDDRQKVDESNQAVVTIGKPIPLEYRILKPDGSERVVWAEAGELEKDAEGNPALLRGIVMDITERKQAEAQILQLNTDLEKRVEERTLELHEAQEQLVRKEKLATLGMLAGSVGHELRNPLGVINTSIYYLDLVQPQADEKIKQHHAMIQQEVRNADKIISDLLDFGRNINAERERVSVSEIVQSTLARFKVPATLKVVLELPAEMPKIFADPRQVEQILGNLTINACQVMVSQVSTTGVSTGGKLTISAKKEKEMVVISVKDTGTGISPENIKKLFEPLFSTKINGIGLGLAVSRKLAEANGGRIEVESELGKGSTFRLYLPVGEE